MSKRKLTIFVISPWSMDVYTRKQRGLVGSSEYRLLRGLFKRGHEVHFMIPSTNEVSRSTVFEGIRIHQFRRLFHAPIISLLSLISFGALEAIRTIKECGKPDVFYGISVGAVTSCILGKIYREPNITRIFGTTLLPHLSSPLKMLHRSNMEELLVFKTPCKYMIITDDGTRGDEVARRLNVQCHKIKFWRNGVDVAQPFDRNVFKRSLGISASTKIVITLCRLEKWKGVHRIIEVMPDIIAKDEKVILLIVGDGEERDNLEELSNKLNMGRFIKFVGAVSHDEALKYLGIADIFVSLQDYTNLSLPLMEAAANRLCIVTSNSGATGEVIKNGENGFLLPHDDLSELPNVIINLLEDESLKERIGRRAKEYASEHFLTWDERIRIEIDLIERLCEGNDE